MQTNNLTSSILNPQSSLTGVSCEKTPRRVGEATLCADELPA